MAQAYMRGSSVEQDARASAPLITLFERDDTIAVPLLSQLRMAGYDVRSARTPVELFDILGKHLVTLVLVDLGAATAGRREFWVALDAHRRGRAMQVLTFRYMAPSSDLDLDFEPSARAIADVEIHGAHEFVRVIEAVRQRAPLHGPAPSAAVSYTPDGAIQPIGAALGMTPPSYGGYSGASTPSQLGYGGFSQGSDPGYGQAYGQQPGYGGAAFGMSPVPPSMPQSFPSTPSHMPGAYAAHMETTPFPYGSQPHGQPFPAQFAPSASPFAQPGVANPFSESAETSPFSQPLGANPFAQGPSAPSSPFAAGVGQSVNPFSAPQPNSFPPFGGPPSFANPPSFGNGPAPWGSASSSFNDAPGFPVWRTPDSGGSFSSDPGVQNFFNAGRQASSVNGSHPGRQAPAFQDVWSPPDGADQTETAALSESSFHVGADAWNAAMSEPRRPSEGPQYGTTQPRPWDAPRPNDMPASQHEPELIHYQGFGAPEPEEFEAPTAAIPTPPTPMATPKPQPAKQHKPSTATETALSSVLIEGALLTPGKLETLRGIQDMLSDAEQPRKLGELALMFKFLSADQLLAALLVSRGLVSPQQIASLGKVKQDLAARGDNIDLETLLIRHNILSADQLGAVRQELAS